VSTRSVAVAPAGSAPVLRHGDLERPGWPRNAVLYHRAPAPTGRRGRPRLKGDRIGTPAQAAATAVWRTMSVARYGRTDTVGIAVLDCLWYGVFGPAPVRLVLVHDRETGPMLALITTEQSVTGTDLVAATPPGGRSR
jgi:hypothetical protein